MTGVDLEWVDPPKRGSVDAFDWNAIGEALAERPGEWAKLGEWAGASLAATVAGYVRKNKTALDAATHEARSARIENPGGDPTYGVWCRYVGSVAR